jgi:hypothetical protein
MSMIQLLFVMLAIEWHRAWCAYLSRSVRAQTIGRGYADQSESVALRAHQMALQLAKSRFDSLGMK